jgi:hypothetical protein
LRSELISKGAIKIIQEFSRITRRNDRILQALVTILDRYHTSDVK